MPKPSSKTIQARKARVDAILPILKATYPQATCSLDFQNPLQLLVATMLSAQCTDARVNIVTKDLFARHKTAADFANVPQETLEKQIQSTGFFRNKATNIRAMAATLLEQHDGQVPRTMDELHALPGVGRKTANVVLGNAFGINVGVTVDTHVTRVAGRLGLTKHADAVKIEQDLMPVVPQDDWALWSHLLIAHGRAICIARKPRCAECPLKELCPSAKQFLDQ
ncbi:MAG TPA: endonuclease III [Tepidisphaeraceae bacterium]|jgi:endonuclease-3|nr:endonuclease III [Tepidisphaeraceae bacterium]